MTIFYGIVKPERAVFSATAGPTLTNIKILEGTDWGPDVSIADLDMLATKIFWLVSNRNESFEVRSKFVEDVLRKIATEKAWMLTEDCVREWLEKNKNMVVQ